MDTAYPKAPAFGGFERSLAFRYLRAKREHGGVALISMISLIGIMLAVMALVVVMSVMNGYRSELLNRVLGSSAHVKLYVSGWSEGDAEALTDRIAGLEGVVSAYPVVEGFLSASQGSFTFGAVARGIPRDTLMQMPIVTEGLREGSVDRFALGEKGGSEVIVSASLANEIGAFPGRDLVLLNPKGRQTPFGTKPNIKTYRVGAVFDLQTFNPLDQFVVILPLEQAQYMFLADNRYDAIEVILKEPRDADAMMAEIAPLVTQPASIQSWEETPTNRAYLAALALERTMMRIVFLILLTITALNIITGVVMLVKNKGRDIAILRTIGASRGTIMRVFVMVGGILGIVGTSLGLLLGLLFCWNIEAIQGGLRSLDIVLFDPQVYMLPHLPAKIDWLEVSIATVWAFAMSVLVTFWPAWRAANMDPVEALRFE